MNDPVPDPAEQNVERLLSEAYEPENIDATFAERVLARLEHVAAERRRRPKTTEPLPWRRLAWLYAANAAAILLLIVLPTLFWHFFLEPERRQKEGEKAKTAPPPGDHVTPRPRPTIPALRLLAPGQSASTSGGEKARLRLGDGSTLALNQKTRVRLESQGLLRLDEGELLVEKETLGNPNQADFVIATPSRRVRTPGARLVVRADPRGTSVLVAQGQAVVDSQRIEAGQWLAPGAEQVQPAPRASHALEWARDLLAGESVVPASEFPGGALVARAPDGTEARLSLRRFHVDVHIEEGFARTTIDQTYFNHFSGRLEGTFHFPLPADASLSRLAMYVEGTRMEGGMVEREQGRAIYENIVRSMQDPALLEWVDGTTFKMRVFPLEGRQEKRIILSYTQRLPVLYGKATYRFPAGHSLEEVGEWSLFARLRRANNLAGWQCLSHAVSQTHEGEDVLLKARSEKARLDRDVVLELQAKETEQIAFAEAGHEKARYFMVRYRPELPGVAQKRQRRDWVVLFEASASRDPVLARTQIEIIRTLLEHAEPEDTFSLVSVNTRARVLAGSRKASRENVQQALAELDQLHLIGGLDLGQGFREASRLLKEVPNPWLVHVGSGLPGLGERREEQLLALIPERTPQIGIGVGKRWNRALFRRMAERSGGLAAQINPDEPVAWRTFDLLATLHTPRILDVQVSDPGRKWAFRTESTQLAQGEELFAVARSEEGEKLPEKIVISGTLAGATFQRELLVEHVTRGANYLPRTWGRLEIDRLVAENAKDNKQRIIDLSRKLYVMSPFTSLLVLENEAMYAQYKVERGRKDHWALYECPEKIPVYIEPAEGPRHLVRANGAPQVAPARPSVDQVRRTILVRGFPALGRRGTEEAKALQKLTSSTFDPWLEDPRSERSVRFEPVAGRSGAVHFRTDPLRLLDVKPTADSHKEDVSVSGAIDPEIVVGITGSPELPPLEIPAPPGTVGSRKKSIRVPGLPRSQETEILSLEDELPFLILRREADTRVMHTFPRLGLGRALFCDLLLFAPGLNTSQADVHAVLEAEAELPRERTPGRIDPRARELIEKARSGGWRKVIVPSRPNRPGFTILVDGQGRFRYERQRALGLREIVICDGKTLWHLYPELGLGASRTVSRFHRAELTALVPWLLPPVEDLVIGADVEAQGERTLVVSPHQGRYRVQLVLDERGQLAERVLIDGTNQKELRREKVAREEIPADAPDLRPDVAGLVVLPMPWRSVEHVHAKYPVLGKKLLAAQDEEAALALLTAYVGERRRETQDLIRDRFLARDDRRMGFFTLMAGSAETFDPAVFKKENLKGPLGRYLRRAGERLGVGPDEKRTARTAEPPPADFLHRLLELDELRDFTREQILVSSDYLERSLSLTRDSSSILLSWALLEVFAEGIRRERAAGKIHQGRAEMFLAVLDHLSKALREVPILGSVARYEAARARWIAGQHAEVAGAFLELHRDAQATGKVLPIDAAFRQALTKSGDWRRLMRASADHWLKQNNPFAVVRLAEQAFLTGDDDLEGELLDRVASAGEPRSILTAIAVLSSHNQWAKARRLLEVLLPQPEAGRDPELWRLRARLAASQEQHAQGVGFLEKALDLEWHSRSKGIDLGQAGRDYELLLSHYHRLIEASRELQQQPAPELVRKALRAIERWRVLDPKGPAVEKAWDLLALLGRTEQAWDYLTTQMTAGEPTLSRWRDAADRMTDRGLVELADRCMREALALEPDNAAFVLEWAQKLREAGRNTEARGLLQRLVNEKWPGNYRSVVLEAGSLLGDP